MRSESTNSMSTDRWSVDTLNRRRFCQWLGSIAVASWVGCGQTPPRKETRPLRILVRSSWQTLNIGDIAHTPGLLALLETHLPEARVTLWPTDVSRGVRELIVDRFPNLIMAETDEQIDRAIRENDVFVHGSGAGAFVAEDIQRWREQTGRPYGYFGITLTRMDERQKELLDHAAFLYLRDSHSLAFAVQRDVRCPNMVFGPDAAFACDIRDDAKAERFMADHGLEEGKFLCCIPRRRYTPYWRVKPSWYDMSAAEGQRRRNEEMKEHDNAPLREAIIEVVRQTDLKVLVCPEDEFQMELGKEIIIDKLPADVLPRVVWREDYWLTDEALSTYVRSAGMFALEMHSPIMCIGNGVPAIVCRFKEQTTKGYMWRDIGLGDWLFDMDKPEQVERLAPTVMAMAADPQAARDKALAARDRVADLHRQRIERVGGIAAAAGNVLPA